MKRHDQFSDFQLAGRLERTEGTANASFVDARATVDAKRGAEWIEVAGTYAMFDGPESPLTQTFGLGMFDAASDSILEELETFFEERDAPVFHEVSPLAGNQAMILLSHRGYRPFEATSVMYRPIDLPLAQPSQKPNPEVKARTITSDEWELWAQTAADGWKSEMEGISDFLIDYGRTAAKARGFHAFIAEKDGEAIASGGLSINQGIALLAGAATIPDARRQGAQFALLETRLRFAKEKGCDLAMMCAAPGSASQRNAERHGFRIAYTRLKWMRG